VVSSVFTLAGTLNWWNVRSNNQWSISRDGWTQSKTQGKASKTKGSLCACATDTIQTAKHRGPLHIMVWLRFSDGMKYSVSISHISNYNFWLFLKLLTKWYDWYFPMLGSAVNYSFQSAVWLWETTIKLNNVVLLSHDV
jgi:hypothetical protein